MYNEYGFIFETDQPNCVRSGDYNGMSSPYQTVSETVSTSGTFNILRNHAQRERIIEIDDAVIAASDECKALTGSLVTASDTVKAYLQNRIAELKSSLTDLERERTRLLAI